jgi:hypothetical protein
MRALGELVRSFTGRRVGAFAALAAPPPLAPSLLAPPREVTVICTPRDARARLVGRGSPSPLAPSNLRGGRRRWRRAGLPLLLLVAALDRHALRRLRGIRKRW